MLVIKRDIAKKKITAKLVKTDAYTIKERFKFTQLHQYYLLG